MKLPGSFTGIHPYGSQTKPAGSNCREIRRNYVMEFELILTMEDLDLL